MFVPRRLFSSSTAAAARKFFVGGNWKCNGSAADVQVGSRCAWGVRVCVADFFFLVGLKAMTLSRPFSLVAVRMGPSSLFSARNGLT
jgi:hypothetical protein